MILCAILYVLNYSLLGSQSQGDPVYFLSARSLAMGGIGSILEEPGSFCRNAGALGLMNKATLNLSLRGLSHREQRSLRVYDPYANNMGLSTVFDYSSQDYSISEAAGVYTWKNLKAGLAYAQEWDFGYESCQEIRNEFYQLTTTEHEISRGGINALHQGLCFSFTHIYLGAGHVYLFGHRAFSYEKYDCAARISETRNQQDRFNGNRFDVGLLFDYQIHIRGGLAAHLPHTVSFGGSKYDYPAQVIGALSFQPPLMIPSRIGTEVEISAWSLIDSTLRNIYDLRVGFEHKAGKDHYLRYGFSISPDYRNRGIYLTSLTFGLGIDLRPLIIDLGYCFSRCNFTVRDFQQLSYLRPPNLSFEETTHYLIVTFGLGR